MLELDQYYTPAETADQILETVGIAGPSACIDPTCGTGSLLLAAERRFGDIKCYGLDKDKKNILNLRKSQSHWRVSVADLLNTNSSRRAHVMRHEVTEDLLTLNPPFSMNQKKFVSNKYGEEVVKSSVAMAYVMRSLELFSPTHGAIAIVPESLLFSETDQYARSVLSREFEVEQVLVLERSTFSGARANAAVIRISPRKTDEPIRQVSLTASRLPFLIRGGLPVHEAKPTNAGIPYIHTTELNDLYRGCSLTKLKRVRPIGRGTTSGCLVLLPRVGLPTRKSLEPVYARSRIQLSDCVFAIQFNNMNDAKSLVSAIRDRWCEFAALYRGTGARYTTVRKLSNWLSGWEKTL